MSYESRVKDAADWAKELVYEAGLDYPLANFKAAERFGVEVSSVASELGQRSAFKRAQRLREGLSIAHKRILRTLFLGGRLMVQPDGLAVLYAVEEDIPFETFDRAFIEVLRDKQILTSNLKLTKTGKDVAAEIATDGIGKTK